MVVARSTACGCCALPVSTKGGDSAGRSTARGSVLVGVATEDPVRSVCDCPATGAAAADDVVAALGSGGMEGRGEGVFTSRLLPGVAWTRWMPARVAVDNRITPASRITHLLVDWGRREGSEKLGATAVPASSRFFFLRASFIKLMKSTPVSIPLIVRRSSGDHLGQQLTAAVDLLGGDERVFHRHKKTGINFIIAH